MALLNKFHLQFHLEEYFYYNSPSGFLSMNCSINALKSNIPVSNIKAIEIQQCFKLFPNLA